MKLDMRRFSQRFVLALVAFASLAHCRPSPTPGQGGASASEALGFFSGLFRESAPIKILDASGLAAFSHRVAIFQHVIAGAGDQALLKVQFSSHLLQSIIESGGIHPDQLHRVLREVVGAPPESCGGASCGMLLGFGPSEVDGYLDDLLAKVKTRMAQNPKALSAADQKALLSSLERPKPRWAVNDFEISTPPPRDSSAKFEGICPFPLLQSVGSRSNVELRTTKLSIQSYPESIDFRRQEPKAAQGALGACHTFAMASMLSHSTESSLVAARKLAPEWLLLDNWVERLGNDPRDAARHDLERLKKLADDYRSERRSISANADFEPSSFVDFWQRNFLELTIYEQGGNATVNWHLLTSNGAIVRDANAPRLTVGELEMFTKGLLQARTEVLHRLLVKPLAANTDERLIKALAKAYEPVYSRAAEGGKAPRAAIKKELEGFTLERRTFDSAHPNQALGQLLGDLIKHGPLVAATSDHSFTIVGFDAATKRFRVRDSDAVEPDAYPEYPAEELANTLRNYQYIRPESRH